MEKVYHIGVDGHKLKSYITILDKTGKVAKQGNVDSSREAFYGFFEGIDRNSVIVIESTGRYFWLYDMFKEMGFTVKVANPRGVKLIGESPKKTDKNDSRVLADLSRIDYLPESYVPNMEIRERRQLVRFRQVYVDTMIKYKNKVHSVLARMGIKDTVTDIFGISGKEYLHSIELPPLMKEEIEGYLEMVELHKQKEVVLRKRIENIGKTDPNVKIVASTPGIGYYGATKLMAEVAEISRFPSDKKLLAYAGLVSKVSQTGQTEQHSTIRRDSNKYIRGILVEAVPHALKQDAFLAERYNRIKKGKKENAKKAKIAIAASLLRSIYYMLKTGQEYKARIPKPICFTH
ncbi:MAG: IS110 family transposase [Candidatus Firestonebacteria bacterium]